VVVKYTLYTGDEVNTYLFIRGSALVGRGTDAFFFDEVGRLDSDGKSSWCMSSGKDGVNRELACLTRAFEDKIAVTGFCAIVPDGGGLA
jgi:hypothetical protein